MVHDRQLAQEGRIAGGMATKERQLPALHPDAFDANLKSLPDIPSAMETVYRAVGEGRLNPKAGSTMVFAANCAVSAIKAQHDIAAKERERLEELSDADLDAAFERAMKRWTESQKAVAS